METSDAVLAWHWLSADRQLGYGDLREVRVGETLTVAVKPVVCLQGLHACVLAIDSLNYAPGPIVCRVRLSGIVVRGEGLKDDKHAATARTCLAMGDATHVLHEFAIDCAERALLREREQGREPDARSWAALEVKRRWMRGESTDEDLEAACNAACEVASARARAAARAAASAAAWVADSSAAWAAASSAASAADSAAASAADSSAAWAAELKWQNARLEELLLALLGLNTEASCAPSD